MVEGKEIKIEFYRTEAHEPSAKGYAEQLVYSPTAYSKDMYRMYIDGVLQDIDLAFSSTTYKLGVTKRAYKNPDKCGYRLAHNKHYVTPNEANEYKGGVYKDINGKAELRGRLSLENKGALEYSTLEPETEELHKKMHALVCSEHNVKFGVPSLRVDRKNKTIYTDVPETGVTIQHYLEEESDIADVDVDEMISIALVTTFQMCIQLTDVTKTAEERQESILKELIEDYMFEVSEAFRYAKFMSSISEAFKDTSLNDTAYIDELFEIYNEGGRVDITDKEQE